MSKLLKRALVVVKALPTYMTLVATLVPVIVLLLPVPTVVAAAPIVLAWLGSAIAIIRKVTPVLEEQVGLLPEGDR